MVSGLNFVGLNSSFDSGALIGQLVRLETQSKVAPLERKIASLNSEKSFINKIKSKLDTLKSNLNISAITNGTESLLAKKVTSSDDKSEFASIKASGSASNQSFNLNVSQLATSTIKKSGSYIKSADLTLSSNLSEAKTVNGQSLSDGTVTINGETKNFTASSGTLEDVKNFFESFSGVSANFNESSGKFELDGINNIGSSGDTSSLIKAFGFDKAKVESGSVTSFQNLEVADASTKLSNLGVTATELTINGKTLTLDADSSIADLVSSINADSGLGVNASYDSISGELTLKNLDTGSLSITLGANGDISALNLDTESLGKNAEFSISTLNGGQTIISNSNNVDDLIEGLELELKATGSDISVKVEDDYSGYKDMLKGLATEMSSLIKDLKSSKTSFARNLASKIQSTLGGVYGGSGDKFKSLIDLGFKTNLGADGQFSSVSFDEAKLDDAFNSLDSLNSVLFGGGSGEEYSKLSSGNEGVFVKLDDALNAFSNSSGTGVLGNLLDSNSTRIKGYQNDISRKQASVDNYESRLQKQFSNLDILNAQFQKQQSAVNALASQFLY